MSAFRDKVRELLQTRYSRGTEPRVKSVREATQAEKSAFVAGYGAAVNDVSRFGLDHARKALLDMTRRNT